MCPAFILQILCLLSSSCLHLKECPWSKIKRCWGEGQKNWWPEKAHRKNIMALNDQREKKPTWKKAHTEKRAHRRKPIHMKAHIENTFYQLYFFWIDFSFKMHIILSITAYFILLIVSFICMDFFQDLLSPHVGFFPCGFISMRAFSCKHSWLCFFSCKHHSCEARPRTRRKKTMRVSIV